ncbi:sialidase family protein [Nannocystis radixulma]|uniref:Sialidase family protein n=1 Tax=Nannocystis radixulma TaxID=2995305 RepID=A0ABT5BMX0_9BACT|nr:sialidase family protein [Nannocystis radixulma]MDC0675515.1 sialidase family protein [Nannocystis radixulma]
MKPSLHIVPTLVLLSQWVAAPALAGPGDTVVSDHIYLRQDGGSDPAIAACGDESNTVLAGGKRQQNEPSVAINPQRPEVIVAGANDYCTVPSTGDSWMGFYVSLDGGTSWTDSLNPGYPGDTSAAGLASPIFGRAVTAGDPVMDWDNEDRLFYGGISSNRTKPQNGDVHVSTWEYDPGAPLGLAYLRTVIVGKGTPSVQGRFNDKPSLRADDWEGSPHEGNVYIAWTLFPGFGQDQILFSRSTDHGASFSKPIKISKSVASAQGSDIAVAPDGAVYVTWRQFDGRSRQDNDAIVFVKSTDGGQTFSDPRTVQAIVPYDRADEYVTGDFARECGDESFLCASGFVFHREVSEPNAVVDADSNVYVTWTELLPAADNDDTYRPDGQGQVVISRSADGGASWSDPVFIDPQATGHQWWPNLEYDRETGTIVAVYYDSRADPSYSASRPPGNEADATSPCGAPGSPVCEIVNTYFATSTDGLVWSATLACQIGHQPEYEMFSNRQVPFHGDYLWIDANGGSVYGVWTDNRDVVPGVDPREATQDGFDVLQCRALEPDGSFGPDTCPNAGGLNQNIYGAHLSLP